MTTATNNEKWAITQKPVWFITGCSTGFGRELAKLALERGYRTVVTARNLDEVNGLAAEGEALVLKLDVTDQGQIDYAATAGAWRRQARATSGKQPGDPVRAAHAIVKAIESPSPPHHRLLGNDAYKGATAKLEDLRKQFSAWEAVSRGADCPKEGRL